MYAWPVAWFMFLIYVIGPAFVQSDGTYPLWAYNLIGVLGNGAELLVALLIFRREGYRLTPKALRARVNSTVWPLCLNQDVIRVGRQSQNGWRNNQCGPLSNAFRFPCSVY